jgi:hypothetical protein
MDPFRLLWYRTEHCPPWPIHLFVYDLGIPSEDLVETADRYGEYFCAVRSVEE